MPEPTVWVAADSRCGHPVVAFGDREQLERQVNTVLGDRAEHLQVREATDDDLIHLLRGDRCTVCTFDGGEVVRGG